MSAASHSHDKRALAILMNTYWTATGWRPSANVEASDFEYAKAAGYMFDSIRLTHNEVVARACRTRDRVNLQSIADAFLSSLSNRQLYLRSALGSFAVARHLRPHDFHGKYFCDICGLFGTEVHEIDLSVFNFERHKWGGVRHRSPDYILFDLEQFESLAPVNPSQDDIRIFREILSAIGSLDPSSRAEDIQKSLQTFLSSNKAEREIVILILSYCGILSSPATGSFFDHFIPYSERDFPSLKWDRATASWRGNQGIALKPLISYFGHRDLM